MSAAKSRPSVGFSRDSGTAWLLRQFWGIGMLCSIFLEFAGLHRLLARLRNDAALKRQRLGFGD